MTEPPPPTVPASGTSPAPESNPIRVRPAEAPGDGVAFRVECDGAVASPAGPPWRCVRATPELRAAAEALLLSHGIQAGAAQSGVLFLVLAPATEKASPEDVARALAKACDALTLLGEVRDLIRAAGQERQNECQRNRRLQQEIERLHQMQGRGLFDFALKVEPEDFRAFLAIMAHGNANAAWQSLGVAQRTLYERLERWKFRDGSYRKMLECIRWRKAVGRKIKKRLPDSSHSGAAGGATADPKLLEELLAATRESGSRDYPSLLRQLLEVLLLLTPENCERIRGEIVPWLEEELAQ